MELLLPPALVIRTGTKIDGEGCEGVLHPLTFSHASDIHSPVQRWFGKIWIFSKVGGRDKVQMVVF